MNKNVSLNANLILEKIKKIDNTYDLLTEIFSNNINYEQDPNIKYFILTIFLQKKNIQLSFKEVWCLFKVLVSINDKLIKEKSETNELYALCLENCTKLLFKALTNLNIDKNFGFNNKEIHILFDFLFSLPLVKHFINLVEAKKQKEGINNLLNQIGKLISEKIQISQNDIIKNIFNSFSHFLNLNEINNLSINNLSETEDKNISLQPKSNIKNNSNIIVVPSESEIKYNMMPLLIVT